LREVLLEIPSHESRRGRKRELVLRFISLNPRSGVGEMRLGVALLTTAVLGASALADSIVGTYYAPYQRLSETTSYPEELRIFDTKGVLTDYTIIEGRRETYVSRYIVKGNTITLKPGHYINSCHTVEHAAPKEASINYQRTPTQLFLKYGTETYTYQAASKVQIRKVLAVPACPPP
jgi:hypothetical protein